VCKSQPTIFMCSAPFLRALVLERSKSTQRLWSRHGYPIRPKGTCSVYPFTVMFRFPLPFTGVAQPTRLSPHPASQSAGSACPGPRSFL